MQRQLDDIRGIPDGPDPDAGDSGVGEFPAPPDFGKDDFPPEEETLPDNPNPFPLPPNFGGKSKSGGVKLPPQPPFGTKEGALPPPTPAPAVPEPNPFNPK